MRSIQKVISHLDGGNYVPTDDITLTLRDATNNATILGTANYSSGAYTVTFAEVAKWAVWAIDGVVVSEWGVVWMGAEDALVLAWEFEAVPVGSSPLIFTSGTDPLDEDSRGNAPPTFTTVPSVYVQGDQERQVFISTQPTLSSGDVTFAVSLGEIGADNPGGNTCRIMIVSNEKAKT
jgi:hypothetical protein